MFTPRWAPQSSFGLRFYSTSTGDATLVVNLDPSRGTLQEILSTEPQRLAFAADTGKLLGSGLALTRMAVRIRARLRRRRRPAMYRRAVRSA